MDSQDMMKRIADLEHRISELEDLVEYLLNSLKMAEEEDPEFEDAEDSYHNGYEPEPNEAGYEGHGPGNDHDLDEDEGPIESGPYGDYDYEPGPYENVEDSDYDDGSRHVRYYPSHSWKPRNYTT